MRRRIYIILFFCITLAVTTAYGQVLKDDMAKVNEAYLNHQKFSIKLVYKLYSDYTIAKATEEKTGIIKKSGNQFYASYLGMEIFQDKTYEYIINHPVKTISIGNKPQLAKPMVPDLDKTLKSYSNQEYKDNGNGRGTYTFHFKNFTYSKVELEFDRTTFMLTRVVYYFAMSAKVEGSDKTAKPRMEIEFSQIDFNPSFSKNDFSTARFFDKKNKKQYALKPAYKNYKITAK